MLVIDDDRDVRHICAVVLEQLTSWSVRTAPSVEEGLALARREAPDVVLLDLTMPSQEGGPVIQSFRADPIARALPVILLTARHREDPVVKAAIEHGALGLITKPFDPLVLCERIGELVGAQAP